MSDVRKHRGPHPNDVQLFGESEWPAMQSAVLDLSWLLDRSYAISSSLKLVGDRYALRERQRTAVKRSTCSTGDRQLRTGKCTLPGPFPELWIDGFNLLTTIEVALSGGVIIVGQDGCYRDMASMHGTYRKVEETIPALQLIGSHLADQNIGRVHWLLDQPVSNSGRLAGVMRNLAADCGWSWDVETVRDPDVDLIRPEKSIVVSADSMILNQCQQWYNLAADIVSTLAKVWLVPLNTRSPR